MCISATAHFSCPDPGSQMPQSLSEYSQGKRSTPACDGTGHKNIARWSEGHKSRAGYLIHVYHNVDAP